MNIFQMFIEEVFELDLNIIHYLYWPYLIPSFWLDWTINTNLKYVYGYMSTIKIIYIDEVHWLVY